MNLKPPILYLFKDILLIRNNEKLEFKVFRKPTCKNTHINFIHIITPTLKEESLYVFTLGLPLFAPRNI